MVVPVAYLKRFGPLKRQLYRKLKRSRWLSPDGMQCSREAAVSGLISKGGTRTERGVTSCRTPLRFEIEIGFIPFN